MEKVVASLGDLRGTAERNALGRHLIAEIWTEHPHLLDDLEYLKNAVETACRAGNLTVVDVLAHKFAPHGATLIALLMESHISIHTWPEHGYAAVDVFACAGDPERALDVLAEQLRAHRMETMDMDRGLLPEGETPICRFEPQREAPVIPKSVAI